jgi:hypothetical protein
LFFSRSTNSRSPALIGHEDQAMTVDHQNGLRNDRRRVRYSGWRCARRPTECLAQLDVLQFELGLIDEQILGEFGQIDLTARQTLFGPFEIAAIECLAARVPAPWANRKMSAV